MRLILLIRIMHQQLAWDQCSCMAVLVCKMKQSAECHASHAVLDCTPVSNVQIERDEYLRSFQSYTNRFRHSYEASFSTNPLYYSTNIGRECRCHSSPQVSTAHSKASLVQWKPYTGPCYPDELWQNKEMCSA